MTPTKPQVTQADRDAAATWLHEQGTRFPSREAEAAMVERGEYDEHSLVQAFARHRQQSENALREVLDEILAAQNVQPYRGWNITKLNAAVDNARALLNLPSVRDLNPDIAKMQDCARAALDGRAEG